MFWAVPLVFLWKLPYECTTHASEQRLQLFGLPIIFSGGVAKRAPGLYAACKYGILLRSSTTLAQSLSSSWKAKLPKTMGGRYTSKVAHYGDKAHNSRPLAFQWLPVSLFPLYWSQPLLKVSPTLTSWLCLQSTRNKSPYAVHLGMKAMILCTLEVL